MSNSPEKTAPNVPKKLVVSIATFGCQMNAYDSEVAEGLLSHQGYELVPDALESEAHSRNVRVNADVFLMNTCSVREHAEDRVYGRLGMLSKYKETHPDLIIGLMGCMVEEHREKLFRRFPALDLMVGTRNIKELPELIEEVRKNRRQVAKIRHDGISIEYTDQISRKGRFHAWLPIMTGCNKVCTFCIVPITRGSEVSMPARDVYREASRLVSEGVKWITLLGQNVNSYDGNPHPTPLPEGEGVSSISLAPLAGRGQGEGKFNFPELLQMLCEIEGLEKISFTTSHPQDATPELYEVIARNPKLSRRFHLPLQSGSDRMLKRMKRLHTYAEFKEKIDRMRQMIPDVSITTDIIAGFSGETDEDHEATCRALRELRFDSGYVYKYSLRPETPAANLPDDVPMVIKEKRNNELFQIQKQIEIENLNKLVGRVVETFVEQASDWTPGKLIGRTYDEHKVVFPGDERLVGQFLRVRLDEVQNLTFLGTLREY